MEPFYPHDEVYSLIVLKNDSSRAVESLARVCDPALTISDSNETTPSLAPFLKTRQFLQIHTCALRGSYKC